MACRADGPRAPVLQAVAPHPELAVCVEREARCDRATHVELVNGKPVTVIAATDCVGARSVECTRRDGRREVIAGIATDVVGLGGGRYRYLAWRAGAPTLVTVDGARRTEARGGAPREYGPFAPGRLTAQSQDGRIAAEPDGIDDETFTSVRLRDTIRDAVIARIALPAPVTDRDRRVLIDRDGTRLAVCARRGGRSVVTLADRVVALPGPCLAADPALAQVLIHTGIAQLEVVDLASGARRQLDARDAAFVGGAGVLTVRRPGPRRRDNPARTDLLAYVELATGRGTPLGEVPFTVDEIRVSADRRAAVLYRTPDATTPARAWVVRLPDGPGYELAVPPDTVAVTLVP